MKSINKKCKVVMLSTKKMAPIGDYIICDESTITVNISFGKKIKENDLHQEYHLYVLSDEEIKKEDWYVVELFKVTGESDGFHIEQCNSINDNTWVNNNQGITKTRHIENCKKIIATTDTSLKVFAQYIGEREGFMKEVPQPSQEFIEKYIKEYNKGNIITEVLIEYEDKGYNQSISDGKFIWIEKLYPKINPKDNTITTYPIKDNWNREEVEDILVKCCSEIYSEDGILKGKTPAELYKWIEQNL